MSNIHVYSSAKGGVAPCSIRITATDQAPQMYFKGLQGGQWQECCVTLSNYEQALDIALCLVEATLEHRKDIGRRVDVLKNRIGKMQEKSR